MTPDILKNILGKVKYNDQVIRLIVDTLNETFKRYEIITTIEQNHFLAQVLHETMAFRHREEIWDGKGAQEKYDTRVDLGNTPEVDGDGKLYRGRGWFQLTGKYNYRLASKEFDIDFVKDPNKASIYPYCGLIAGWYWKRKNIAVPALRNDIKAVTKLINGGYNGIDDRIQWFERCKKYNE